MDQRPIGVFDSGLGGLTVVKEIMKELPNENIVYFGDTARIPYGGKSKETVIRYSRQIIRFLLTKNIKAIIIACNTASATALEAMQREFDVPIIGVVYPGAKMAASATKNKRIGIIATETTIRSRAYGNAILKLREDVKIFPKACPLLVPLAEEGWVDNEVTHLTLERYLTPIREEQVDALLLGCTHYPLLIDSIQKAMGSHVTLVNPAEETAKETRRILEEQGMASTALGGSYEYYVSDDPDHFIRMGSVFLQKNIAKATEINIEAF